MNQTQLTLQIYDCALQPTLWPDTLQQIADQAGALGAMIFDRDLSLTRERVALRMCSPAYAVETVQTYIAAFNDDEVRDQARFAQLSSRGDEVNLIRCDDLTPSRSALELQPNVIEMMGKGVYYRAGALLSKDTDAMDRFALQFLKHQGPISEPARQMVENLLPHVAKSLSIGRSFWSLHVSKQSLVQLIEALPFGVAIAASDGSLLFTNSEFARLAEDYHLCSRGRSQLAFGQLPAAMAALLADTGNHGKTGARPLREAGFMAGEIEGTGLFMEISPIRDHPEFERFDRNCYLISMLDSHRAHSINPEVVARFFPMSASELAVLDLVVKGHTNAEMAEIRGRSTETVNSQVKSLIRKSGTRNRTELVRVAVGLSVASLK
jgi:DNA-binding CsgD family transcriptional regulator